jgi:hypothetical protein
MREAAENNASGAVPDLSDETTKFLKETANPTNVAIKEPVRITPVAHWSQKDDADEQVGLTPTMEENSGVLTAVDAPEGLTPQTPKDQQQES